MEHLIQKFWKNDISLLELRHLYHLISSRKEDLQKQTIINITQLQEEDSCLLTKQKSDGLLRQINSKIEVEGNTSKVKMLRYWWVAASIIGVILIISYQVFINNARNENLPSDLLVTNKGLSKIHTASNTLLVPKIITLEDSSIVTLEPGAIITYRYPFENNRRDISLKGNAWFKVAKDKSKPFTVYAGDFSTTALGTVFEIRFKESEIFKVKLIEGRVKISRNAKDAGEFNDIYLIAGQKLSYDLRQDKVIREPKEHFSNRANKTINSKPQLSFSRLPLEVVLKELESEFSTTIVYEPHKINGIIYTGSFVKEKTPFNILTSICKEYNLKLKFENNAYIIE